MQKHCEFYYKLCFLCGDLYLNWVYTHKDLFFLLRDYTTVAYYLCAITLLISVSRWFFAEGLYFGKANN